VPAQLRSSFPEPLQGRRPARLPLTNAARVRAREICAGEVRDSEVRDSEICEFEVCACEVSAVNGPRGRDGSPRLGQRAPNTTVRTALYRAGFQSWRRVFLATPCTKILSGVYKDAAGPFQTLRSPENLWSSISYRERLTQPLRRRPHHAPGLSAYSRRSPSRERCEIFRNK